MTLMTLTADVVDVAVVIAVCNPTLPRAAPPLARRIVGVALLARHIAAGVA